MAIVFGYVLYYTKLKIFTTVTEILQGIRTGELIDPQIIEHVSTELEHSSLLILIGMVVFSIITGIIVAHITLIPTRKEFAQHKRFINIVAHELRTPLAVMRTSNEVALYDIDKKSPVKAIIENNIEEIKHIATILTNLVFFSRDGNDQSLIFEKVDIQKILERSTNTLRPFAQKHGVTIAYTSTPTVPIYANKTSIEQVFYTLIKNAIMYSKVEGGLITIDTNVQHNHLTIVFGDTGIGISEKNIKHIFEPFFRITDNNRESIPGSGLGLALVLEIIKLHKGSITAKSEETIGTVFTLQFPLQG
jgi:signal transduction histidine kinase